MSNLLGALALSGSSSAVGYEIERSLRFNSADTAYLSRTFTSAGNRQVWTYSCWVKRSTLSADNGFFLNANPLGSNYTFVGFGWNSGENGLYFYEYNGASFVTQLNTTAQFRDVSAWYHIVITYDRTQATSSNRIKLYVNGVQQTAFNTAVYPSQNTDGATNQAALHWIGRNPNGYYSNGYLTEINFIDGQALTPSSFGETNPITGVWQPKAYEGTYGTNGFYLPFNDNTSPTTLGYDQSGNDNDWTLNLFSVTAGADNDSLVDTPTPYGRDAGLGGEVRGNYCTINPLVKSFYAVTPANGNLNSNGNASGWTENHGTIGVSSGKWYWEVKPYDAFLIVGIRSSTYITGQSDPHTRTGALTWYGSTGALYVNGSSTATNLGTFDGTNTLGFALDMDAGTIQFYKDNVAAGSAQSLSSTIGSNLAFPCMFNSGTSATFSVWNFGQRPFTYTAPSGFKALCTQNLPEPTIKNGSRYFDAVTYTGNGANVASGGQTISSLDFRPDWVWIKKRTGTPATNHALFDVVRGANVQLQSNNTFPEFTMTEALVSFTGTGFTLGNSSNVNANANTYVAWSWTAGGEPTPNNNSDGSITSTVSVNQKSGLAVIRYVGTGANANIGHGLGAAPSMVIVKQRNGTSDWQVRHTSIAAINSIQLNTNAVAASAATVWNNTNPTTTVFSVGTNTTVNSSGNSFIAYAFTPVAGYSAFGSYVGNGSADGPFIFTNHRPAFVLIKRTDTTSNWTILDFQREGYNVDNDPLYPNLSNAEGTTDLADLLSNGFKLRTTDASVNASGGTYIYMSLASNPFKFSLAR